MNTQALTSNRAIPARIDDLADSAQRIGAHAVRYGLVAVIAYVGLMKFTAYEAGAIKGLVSNSPLMAWTYNLFSVRTLAALIGSVELITAALLALRPWSAKGAAIGSLLAIGTFVTTLSFLFSTPGVVEASLGFPALSVMPGQFLAKDIALLGIAVWTLGDALKGIAQTR